MTVRAAVLTVLLAVALPATCWAGAKVHDPPGGDAETHADGFRAFQLAFVGAVLDGDVDRVVKLTAFPLMSYEMAGVIAKAEKREGPLEPEVTEAQFRKYFKRLFNKQVRKHLATGRPLRHDASDGDDDPSLVWYSIGHSHGKTWAAWFVFSGGNVRGGEWKLVRTDNVSE
ncbi:MAG: hypothetical protein ACOYOB_10565 [Myxococcota bacterium]